MHSPASSLSLYGAGLVSAQWILIMCSWSAIKADMIRDLAANDAAESATYTPGTGSPRTIKMYVRRISADPYRHIPAPVIQVTVVNDSTSGISSSSINVGVDRLTCAERVGETAAARYIHRIVQQNPACMVLELR